MVNYTIFITYFISISILNYYSREKEDEENSGEQTPSIKSFFKPKVGTTRNKHKFFIQRHLTNTINL